MGAGVTAGALSKAAVLRLQGPFRPRSPKRVGVDLADTLLSQIRALRLPLPEREFRPWMDRRFRIDLAWPAAMIALEVDGGEYSHGRHGRGAGMQTDCEKQNRLALEGWAVFRVTGSQVRSGYAASLVGQVLSLSAAPKEQP